MKRKFRIEMFKAIDSKRLATEQIVSTWYLVYGLLGLYLLGVESTRYSIDWILSPSGTERH